MNSKAPQKKIDIPKNAASATNGEQKVFQAELLPEETGELGVIGVGVESNKGDKYVARAYCNETVEANQPYTLTAWNFRPIHCPITKDHKSDCRLCLGEGKLLSFSYVLEKGTILESTAIERKVWMETAQERKDRETAQKQLKKKIGLK